MGPIGAKKSKHYSTAGLIRLMALSVLALSFVFRPGSLPKIGLCFFYAATGLQCPGCGMTRAFCAISHGQFADAWALNPFSFMLYALTALGVLYPRALSGMPEKAAIVSIAALTAALAVFGVFRALADLGLFLG